MSDTDADALETRLEEEPGVAKAREKGGKNAVQASKRKGVMGNRGWGGHKMIIGLLV